MIQSNESSGETVDLKFLIDTLWGFKKIILGITSFFAAASVIYSLNLPNIYTSKTILAPVNQEESLTSKLGSLSSFASFSGVNLPNGMTPNTIQAITRITTFEFFANSFLPNINLENIMAVESWDPMTNTIIYDDEIYDEKNSEWVRGYKFPKQQIPSDQEAFLIYLDSIKLIQDKETQFITLSMSHQSPFIAKKWLDIVNHNINEVIREKDKKNAEKAIIFLNDSAKSTNIQSLKEVTSTLLETQMQTLMLAASNQAYVLEIIDPPIVPELRSSPKRALICIFGSILGMFIAIMFCLLSKFTFNGKFLK